VKLGPVEITASRWPWQWYLAPDPKRAHTPQGKRYGWNPDSVAMSRFGGGWSWKLGVSFGGKTILLDLLFGIVRITWHKPAPVKQ
jgi:hypothetical protein